MDTRLAAALAAALAALPGAALAQEPQLATFQETAHVVIDRQVSGSVDASVVLQSTSGQEIMVPPEAEALVLAGGRVASVVATNVDGCVPGVSGASCLMVSVGRPGGAGLMQEEARAAGDGLAAALGGLLGAEPRFHSTYIHAGGGASDAFGTQGAVSGGGVVSAVYTMPAEGTREMYARLAERLLPGEIRAAGGFYDAALALSGEEGAVAALSMIPQGQSVLYQLKVSAPRGDARSAGPEVRPVELLGAGHLSRSAYFAGGFYPLNSIVQVTLVGDGSLEPARPGAVESVERGGLLAPADPGQAGWLPEEPGEPKVLRYLFGRGQSVQAGDLAVAVSGGAPGGGLPEGAQLAVLAVIAAGAAGAAALFLRGYGRGG